MKRRHAPKPPPDRTTISTIIPLRPFFLIPLPPPPPFDYLTYAKKQEAQDKTHAADFDPFLFFSLGRISSRRWSLRSLGVGLQCRKVNLDNLRLARQTLWESSSDFGQIYGVKIFPAKGFSRKCAVQNLRYDIIENMDTNKMWTQGNYRHTLLWNIFFRMWPLKKLS